MSKKPRNSMPDVKSAAGMASLAAWLPNAWEQKMVETKAFGRARKIRTPLDLLQLIFAYVVLHKSLPEMEVWSSDMGIAEIAFPSLWERFQRSANFMMWLMNSLLLHLVPPLHGDWIFTPIDATTFSLPGSKKRDWLVHAAWCNGGFIYLKITKGKGKGNGESFAHYEELSDRAVALTDRAYGTPPQVTRMEGWGKKYVTRFTWNNLPLYNDRDGKDPLDPRVWLAGLLPNQHREIRAWVRAEKQDPVQVRIVAVRKDPEKGERARKAARDMSTRKGHKPRELTLFLADYVTLATNLTPEEMTLEAVAAAYRWRWQIEMAFKRFKSTMKIRRLVNQNEEMVRFYLYAAFCIWLLTERIARERAFFPWGYPLGGGSW